MSCSAHPTATVCAGCVEERVERLERVTLVVLAELGLDDQPAEFDLEAAVATSRARLEARTRKPQP